MMSIASCTQTPRTITKTEYIYVTPPKSWMQKEEIPKKKLKTNEDMLELLIDLKEINEKHNSDKENLRLWKESIEGKDIKLGTKKE